MENFDQAANKERNIESDKRAFLEAVETEEIKEVETEFDSRALEAARQQVNTEKIFLLGEVHGVRENPAILYTFVKKFGFRNLGLEWDKSLQEVVDHFLRTGDVDFESIKNSADGRITADHFALLQKLQGEGLLDRVICFDEESSSGEWDARDANMARNILDNLSSSPTLIVAGNLHTEVAPVTFEGDASQHHPMGENIKSKIPNVPSGRIEYFSGAYHNLGARELTTDVKDRPTKSKFYKSSDDTYVFSLPKASPAVVPNPTEVL